MARLAARVRQKCVRLLEIEFHVDSVQTIRDMLSQKATLPGLLARRRVKIKGSMATLQKRGQAFESLDMKAVLANVGADVFGDVNVNELLQQMPETPPGTPGQLMRQPSAAAWVPNEAVTCCGTCHRAFTVVRRRHHCRGCGGIFCNSCAPKPPGLVKSTRHLRLCGQCRRGGSLECAGRDVSASTGATFPATFTSSTTMPSAFASETPSTSTALLSTPGDQFAQQSTNCTMTAESARPAAPSFGNVAHDAAAATAAAAQLAELQFLKGELQNIRETQLHNGAAARTLR